VHDRAPTHFEAVTIANAARIQQRLCRPASAEDLGRLVNTGRRLLKGLGLDAAPRHGGAASTDVPMPTDLREARK
jgi:hypothetical protein